MHFWRTNAHQYSPARILSLPVEIKLQIFLELANLDCHNVEPKKNDAAWPSADDIPETSETITKEPKICYCRRLRLILALASTCPAFARVYILFKQTILRAVLSKAVGGLPKHEINRAIACAITLRSALTDNNSNSPISHKVAASIIQEVLDGSFTLEPIDILLVLDTWGCLSSYSHLLYGAISKEDGRRALYCNAILRLCQSKWKIELTNYPEKKTHFGRVFWSLFDPAQELTESAINRVNWYGKCYWRQQFDELLENYSYTSTEEIVEEETIEVMHKTLFKDCVGEQEINFWGERRLDIPEAFYDNFPPIVLFRLVFFGITPDIEKSFREHLYSEDKRLRLQEKLQKKRQAAEKDLAEAEEAQELKRNSPEAAHADALNSAVSDEDALES